MIVVLGKIEGIWCPMWNVVARGDELSVELKSPAQYIDIPIVYHHFFELGKSNLRINDETYLLKTDDVLAGRISQQEILINSFLQKTFKSYCNLLENMANYSDAVTQEVQMEQVERFMDIFTYAGAIAFEMNGGEFKELLFNDARRTQKDKQVS